MESTGLPNEIVEYIETVARRHRGSDVMDITCDVVNNMIGRVTMELEVASSSNLLTYLRSMSVPVGEDPPSVFIARVAREVERIRGASLGS